jgi:hypothetical protein
VKRIDTPRGPVYVRPGDSGSAVVYVHGFYETAQGAANKLQPLFTTGATVIIPEAPQHGSDPVRFPNLGELLLAAGVPNADPVVVIGHSGAHKTIRNWLGNPQLKHIIALDMAYGSIEPFIEWGRQAGHSMAVVGFSTREKSERLAREVGAPYHAGKSHEDFQLIPSLLQSSPVGGVSIGVIAMIAVAGFVFYRWLVR